MTLLSLAAARSTSGTLQRIDSQSLLFPRIYQLIDHSIMNSINNQLPRRGGGPKSEAGKARSALNATRHGLSSRHLLLPGEDPAVYEQRTTAIFESFAPTNEAEAEVVALIADDMWRLDRLTRIEQGLSNARIEDLRSQTTLASDIARLVEVTTNLGREVITWEQELAQEHLRTHLVRRMSALGAAVSEAVAVTSPQLAEPLLAAFDSAMYVADQDTKATTLSTSMFECARRILGELLTIGHALDARDVELRKALANVVLPEEAELKKLQRYRRMLEEGLHRKLGLLEMTRSLTAKSAPEMAEKSREYRVKLRLVPA